MGSDHDPLRSLMRRLAGQVLAEASALTPPASILTVSAGDDFLSLTVILAPATTKDGRSFTPCERNILTVLETIPTRLSTSRMLTELGRRGLVHGDSTIGKALTRLAKLGVIKSSRRAPRGYYLPGKFYPLTPRRQN